MPGGLSVDNLENFAKGRFGKGFSASQRGRLDDVVNDSDIVGNREEFVKQVSAIIEESFGKTRKGKTKAQDAQKIAKMANDFHKLSTESVDTEGLLRAIMTNPKMSIALLNAIFSDKHGGKSAVIAKMFEEFTKNKGELDKVTQDAGFAKKIADEIMGGLGGALERLKGSGQNAVLAFGEANAVWLKPLFDSVGNE